MLLRPTVKDVNPVRLGERADVMVGDADVVVQPAERARRVPAALGERPHARRDEHPADQRRVDQDRQPTTEAEELDEADLARRAAP